MGLDTMLGEFKDIKFDKVLEFAIKNQDLALKLQNCDPDRIYDLIPRDKVKELFEALGLDPNNPDHKEKFKKILETLLQAGPGLNGMINNLSTSLMGQMMGPENSALRELATRKGGKFEGADRDPIKFLGMLNEFAPDHKTTTMLNTLNDIRKEFNEDRNGLKAMAGVVNTVGMTKGFRIYQGISKDPKNAAAVIANVMGLDKVAKVANAAASKHLNAQSQAQMATASASNDVAEKPGARPADSSVTIPAGQEQKTAFDPIKDFRNKAVNEKGEYKTGYAYKKSGTPEKHTYTFPSDDEALEFMHKSRQAGLEVKGHGNLEKLYEKKYAKPEAKASAAPTPNAVAPESKPQDSTTSIERSKTEGFDVLDQIEAEFDEVSEEEGVKVAVDAQTAATKKVLEAEMKIQELDDKIKNLQETLKNEDAATATAEEQRKLDAEIKAAQAARVEAQNAKYDAEAELRSADEVVKDASGLQNVQRLSPTDPNAAETPEASYEQDASVAPKNEDEENADFNNAFGEMDFDGLLEDVAATEQSNVVSSAEINSAITSPRPTNPHNESDASEKNAEDQALSQYSGGSRKLDPARDTANPTGMIMAFIEKSVKRLDSLDEMEEEINRKALHLNKQDEQTGYGRGPTM